MLASCFYAAMLYLLTAERSGVSIFWLRECRQWIIFSDKIVWKRGREYFITSFIKSTYLRHQSSLTYASTSPSKSP